MVRPFLPLLALLALGCHPPWPDSGLPEGDTDADTDADGDADADGDVDNPPEELCGGTWGEIDSALTADQDGNVHWVTPGTPQGLIFYIHGQLDLCDMGCTAGWVEPYYLTDSEAYQNQISLPLRMDEEDRYWAYFYLTLPDELPDSDEYCWVETSLGRYYAAFYVRGY